MPELPEVETVVRGLREIAVGREITRAKLIGEKLKRINPRNFPSKIKGRRFVAARRRGKNILLDLSGDLTLWAHLKMTGQFVEHENGRKLDKHDHLVFDLAGSGKLKSSRLVFRDVRKFGFVKLVRTSELGQLEGLAKLGPEPLELSREDFVQLIRTRHRAIKPALLDQTLMVGMGNIYADETLYAARIHPQKLTDEVSKIKLTALYHAIQRILTTAIERMGTTVDNYSGVNGQPGEFQNYLKVYGREGAPCERCGKKITRQMIGQRSAHFCNKCQRY